GHFSFYTFTLGLLFQLLLTARFLRRFGIGTALFVLPVIVFLGSTGLLVLGTLASAVALKGGDQTLRYSLDKSTAELLYLPISARVKLQVKWFIDTVIWRLGDGLSGLIVLIFATWLHLPARQISWVVLVLVGRAGKRSEEHTSELQSRSHLVCRLPLEDKQTPAVNARPRSE